MNKMLALLFFGFAFAQPVRAGDELIVLDIAIVADDVPVSHPRIALALDADASIRQEFTGGGVLEVAFHSTRLADDGVEMQIEVDRGEVKDEHNRSRHLALRWDEAFELAFPMEDGTPVRLSVTPSRADRDRILATRKDERK